MTSSLAPSTARSSGIRMPAILATSHANRAKTAPVSVVLGDLKKTYTVDQRTKAEDDVIDVDTLQVAAGSDVIVVIGTKGAAGLVHIDAVRLLKVP